MRILDGDQYSEIYSQKFLSYFSNWRHGAPSYKKRNAHLVIDKNHAVTFENDEKRSYASGINNALKWILDHGIINSEQMTTLAQWYISCHTDKLKAAIGERFDFLLLDEAQDTSSKQYRLLMQLTEGTNVQFQRFGNPYQALYTIYGNETVDAWNPIVEAEKGVAQVEEISTTVRFGPHIANLVKNVCCENYPTFHPSKSSSSLENCLIIFEDEEDLRRKYQRLIHRCVTENTDFLECHKKDEIVAPLHEDLKRWFPDYDRSLSASIDHNQKYKDVFNGERKISCVNA
ncbi:UvrD-helicase domain-containing protein [Levilactobacillus namurensis]|uniref:UvrD-helicase domain-containing protein n=1 Tax=Levilactobacillus namurensis TaxID=380393 RepID=UPI002230C994|nr:UvrD-helicase domain-containing protein [Levilactobacillus namurensis]MCW3779618.1 UvrD-helicase domain-containing protein [Levilactobacillus namurensis]